MAKQMGLQVHEAVTPNPKAMNKADKDLPCKKCPFLPDTLHSSAHKVPRDGKNYAPQFAWHTPLGW